MLRSMSTDSLAVGVNLLRFNTTGSMASDPMEKQIQALM